MGGSIAGIMTVFAGFLYPASGRRRPVDYGAGGVPFFLRPKESGCRVMIRILPDLLLLVLCEVRSHELCSGEAVAAWREIGNQRYAARASL